MSELLIRTYTIAIGGALVIAFFFWLGRRWAKKHPRARNSQGEATQPETAVIAKPAEPIHAPIDVRLYDSTIRQIYNTKLDGFIPDEIIKTWRSFGRKWLFQGRWVYAINKYQAGDEVKYRPVESMMKATRTNPPSDVHLALTHPEIAIIFDVSEKTGIPPKLLAVCLVVLAMIFVMWMWSSS